MGTATPEQLDVKVQGGVSPLLLDAKDAAALLGIGRSHLYGLHSSGRLGPMPVHLGKRTLWRRDELVQWVENGCPARQLWQAIARGN